MSSTRLRLIVTVAAVCIAPHGAHAQPETGHKRLEAMVGTWQTEMEVAPSPRGPGGQVNGTEECAWFVDLHLVCRSETKAGAGVLYSAIRLISYVPAMKTYAAYTVDSLGLATLALGQISGDIWTFVIEQPAAKSRLVLTMGTDRYTAVSEYSGPNGRWAQASVTKATRAKK